jgi:hypothetical protein
VLAVVEAGLRVVGIALVLAVAVALEGELVPAVPVLLEPLVVAVGDIRLPSSP